MSNPISIAQFSLTHTPSEDGGRFDAVHLPTNSRSYVSYSKEPKESDIQINNMKSETQRQGHITVLLQHVYSQFSGHVHFGEVTEKGFKTASKLGQQFGRTSVENPKTGKTEEY